ncbi:IS481 family transposase ISSde2 [Mannheimia haemolytica]
MFYSNNPLIKHKTGLLNLAEELGNISQACKVMGMSRDTFYRYQQAVEQGGVEALLNQNRRVPNLKNRVDEAIEQAVVKFALDNPAFGQVRVSNELRKQGIFISAGGVRSIWLRHNLANFKQRLNALEKAVAERHYSE